MSVSISQFNPKRSQSGSALIMSLGILTILTLAVAVSMNRSTLQLRMITNTQQQLKITNATFSYLDSLIIQMNNNPSSFKSHVSDLLVQYEANKTSGSSDIPEIDPYTKFNADKPYLPDMDSVGSVTTTMTAEVSPTTPDRGKKFGLKSTPGSTGLKPVYVTTKFIGVDKSGAISSRMVQGLKILAPGDTN